MDTPVLSVSEYVAAVNQTLEYAFTQIQVVGEISEMRISRDRWVYFNLKDENSSIKVFGTVYQLREIFEDGMQVVVKGNPKLHNKYGMSLNISSIRASGEGSIKKAFELMKRKLEAEGLFDESRKREIPVIPKRIGLITSSQAAAYEDFMKIINQRWSGLEIELADVLVQGDNAPPQIVNAIRYFSESKNPVDTLVITRGGGGAEDLMAFSDERVARAVAASRIPTIVGVGHEIDVSLADMAADLRATTPTNAAQLSVPDREVFIGAINQSVETMNDRIVRVIDEKQNYIFQLQSSVTAKLDQLSFKYEELRRQLFDSIEHSLESFSNKLSSVEKQLDLVSPKSVLKRGYSLAKGSDGKAILSSKQLRKGDEVVLLFNEGNAITEVKDVR